MEQKIIEFMNEWFTYEKETGNLIWKRARCRAKAGAVAGYISKQTGYRMVGVLGKEYMAHRLVWLLHNLAWPTDIIDHINHDRLDNRIENLRDVSRQENSRNQKKWTTGTSKYTGVHFRKDKNKWCAQISVENKTKYLGLYSTEEEAYAARLKAEKDYGFHESHGKEP